MAISVEKVFAVVNEHLSEVNTFPFCMAERAL